MIMTRRHSRLLVITIAVILGLGLATVGCGTEPVINSLAPTTTVTLGQSQPVPGGGVSLAVKFDQPLRTGSTPVWYLTVSNDGVDATLNFSSGQRGEVVLLAADDSEVYRWSAQRTFIQVISTESIPTADSLVYELDGTKLAVPPGEYEMVATVLSSPEISPVSQKVTVEP